MFLTYTPEGGGEQHFEFRSGRIRAKVAEGIEKKYAQLSGAKGATWDQFKIAIQQGSASARRVLLWHLLSRDHPTLRIDVVDPYEDEMVLEYSRAELVDLREALLKTPNIPQEEMDAMVTRLDIEIETAPEDGSEGKARSKTSDSTTG